jgi:hypothetical protein
MASITKLGIMFAILAFVARYGLLLHRLNTFSPLPPNHNHFKSCRNIAADTNAFSLDHYTGMPLQAFGFFLFFFVCFPFVPVSVSLPTNKEDWSTLS